MRNVNIKRSLIFFFVTFYLSGCIAPATDSGKNELSVGLAQKLSADGAGRAFWPAITATQAGDVAVAWGQGDDGMYTTTINQFSLNEGWSGATVVSHDAGEFVGEPALAMNRVGDVSVVWHQTFGSYNEVWSNYFSRHSGWGYPALIQGNIGGNTSTDVAMDYFGDAYATWVQGGSVQTSRYQYGLGWALPKQHDTNSIWTNLDPKISANAAGDAFIVWSAQDYENDYGTWARSVSDANEWRPIVEIGNSNQEITNLSCSPRICIQGHDSYKVAVNERGEAVAAWIEYNAWTNNREVWSSAYSEAQGWSVPLLISVSEDGPDAFDVDVALDDRGNAHIVWDQGTYRVLSDESIIYSRRYSPVSGWGDVYSISSEQPGGVGEASISMDGQGVSFISWIQYGVENTLWARAFDTHSGWSAKTRVSLSGDAADAKIAAIGQGRAMIVWRQAAASSIWAVRVALNY